MLTREQATMVAKAMVAEKVEAAKKDRYNQPNSPHFTIGWLMGLLQLEIVNRLMRED